LAAAPLINHSDISTVILSTVVGKTRGKSVDGAVVPVTAEVIGQAHPRLRDLQHRDPLNGIAQLFCRQQALQRPHPVCLSSVQGFAPTD
jgi:hypothetical protein